MKIDDSGRLSLFHWLPVIALSILYLHWMSPTVYWGESPLLTLSSASLGISHPPGYSLFSMLGYVFTRLLPVGNLGYRLNLLTWSLSVMMLSASLVFFSTLSRNPLATTVGVVIFGVTHGFISVSTSGEVYSLNLLLIVLSLILFSKAIERDRHRFYLLLYFCVGIGSVHHLSFLLLIPGILLVLIVYRRTFFRMSTVLSIFVFMILGISILLYPAIRATSDPTMNWGLSCRFGRFLTLILASEEAIPSIAQHIRFSGESLGTFLGAFQLMLSQFHPVILVAGIAGFHHMYRVAKPFFLLMICTFILFTVAVSIYHTHEKESFYLPAIFIMASGVTMCISDLMHRIGNRYHVLWIVMLLSVFIFFSLHALQKDRVRFTKRHSWIPTFMIKQYMNSVDDPGMLISSRSDLSFLCWYMNAGEHYRPEVETLFQRLFTHPWYHDFITKRTDYVRMPSIETGLFEDSQQFADTVRNAMIATNMENISFYFTEPVDRSDNPVLMNPETRLEPYGMLYKVMFTNTPSPGNLFTLDFICGWFPTDPLSWSILTKWFDDRARNLPREDSGKTLTLLLRIKQCLDKANPFL